MRKIDKDTNKWKDTCVHGIEEITLVKMSILFKGIYRLNAIPIKFQ